MTESQFDWADPLLIEHELSEEERMIRDSARRFCEERLVPRVREDFRHERFDRKPRQSVAYALQDRALVLIKAGAEADQNEGAVRITSRPLRTFDRLADRADVLDTRREALLRTERRVSEDQNQGQPFQQATIGQLRSGAGCADVAR